MVLVDGKPTWATCSADWECTYYIQVLDRLKSLNSEDDKGPFNKTIHTLQALLTGEYICQYVSGHEKSNHLKS